MSFSLRSSFALVSFCCLLLGLWAAGLDVFAAELLGCFLMFLIGAIWGQWSLRRKSAQRQRYEWLLLFFLFIGGAVWIKGYFLDQDSVSQALLSGAMPVFLGLGAFANTRSASSTNLARKWYVFALVLCLTLLTGWGTLRWSEMRQQERVDEEMAWLTSLGLRCTGGGIVIDRWGPLRLTNTYTIIVRADSPSFTNADLHKIVRCKLIRELDLSKAQIDDSGIAELQKTSRTQQPGASTRRAGSLWKGGRNWMIRDGPTPCCTCDWRRRTTVPAAEEV